MRAISAVLVAGFLLLAHPALAEPPSPPDVEAVGRLHNLSYDPINDPDDLLGHGWITAQFHLVRVLRGRIATRAITVKYLAHTYRSEDRLIRLRLRARPNGIYLVCAEPGGEGLQCSETK